MWEFIRLCRLYAQFIQLFWLGWECSICDINIYKKWMRMKEAARSEGRGAVGRESKENSFQNENDHDLRVFWEFGKCEIKKVVISVSIFFSRVFRHTRRLFCSYSKREIYSILKVHEFKIFSLHNENENTAQCFVEQTVPLPHFICLSSILFPAVCISLHDNLLFAQFTLTAHTMNKL